MGHYGCPMKRVLEKHDAFGQEMWAYLKGGLPYEIVERDDGYIDASQFTSLYFAEFRNWPKRQRQSIRYVCGTRALDIGCGAGRVALYLQQKKMRVTAIDSSPLAIRTCKRRGVTDARILTVEDMGVFPAKRFDTVIMFGNNFGLFGSYRKARRLLRLLHGLTTDGAVLLAESLNPYKTDDPAHFRYQRRNRGRGRMSGQVRIRIRFQSCVGQWFDYLLVSPDEMRNILEGTGWKMRRSVGDGGSQYVAVIDKT